MNDIDIVITYVNSNDQSWQSSISKYSSDIKSNRYRDWGTLKYLLRGLDKYCQFIRNIFLVVSSESQVPDWISNRVKIVYHKDIIPDEILPTFNSCTIELFLGKIQELSEKFIYFNDDMFIINKCNDINFFRSDYPVISFKKYILRVDSNIYKRQCFYSSNLARRLCGLPRSGWTFIKPIHGPTPMLRSIYQKYYDTFRSELIRSCSRFRISSNLNQYIIPDYCYYSNKYIKDSSLIYVDFKKYSIEEIIGFFNSKKLMLCLNDSGVGQNFQAYSKLIQNAFDRKFPEKSEYER